MASKDATETFCREASPFAHSHRNQMENIMNARNTPLGILGAAVLAVALLVPGCSGDPDEALTSAMASINLAAEPTLALTSGDSSQWDCDDKDFDCQADWFDDGLCTHLHEAAKLARAAESLAGTEPEILAEAADGCDEFIKAVRRGEERRVLEMLGGVLRQVGRYVDGAERHAERLGLSTPGRQLKETNQAFLLLELSEGFR